MKPKILVINSGSSSIKYQLFHVHNWQSCSSGSINRLGEADGDLRHHWLEVNDDWQSVTCQLPVADHHQGLELILAVLRDSGSLGSATELAAIGHRVVHGGEAFSAPSLIDKHVIQGIQAMVPLAPLHNPANLEGIKVATSMFPQTPQVAVFDTAFHQSMPAKAFRYALPEVLYTEHRIRRYGFHGTSHQFVARRAAHWLNKPLESCNLITLHLGNGASAAALKNGISIDTSMGMTPLEGLVMGTRCGDLDPAIHLYLCREFGYHTEELDRLLNKQSGLLGLAGVQDMREIHQRAQGGDQSAILARELFALRIRKYLGAYYAELGRVDALVFTGGIGEHDAWMRQEVCSGLENLGLVLGRDSAEASGERDIAATDSRVRILVIPTNEELEIARQTWETVQDNPDR